MVALVDAVGALLADRADAAKAAAAPRLALRLRRRRRRARRRRVLRRRRRRLTRARRALGRPARVCQPRAVYMYDCMYRMYRTLKYLKYMLFFSERGAFIIHTTHYITKLTIGFLFRTSIVLV
jgi:hypothetical protein